MIRLNEFLNHCWNQFALNAAALLRYRGMIEEDHKDENLGRAEQKREHRRMRLLATEAKDPQRSKREAERERRRVACCT